VEAVPHGNDPPGYSSGRAQWATRLSSAEASGGGPWEAPRPCCPTGTLQQEGTGGSLDLVCEAKRLEPLPLIGERQECAQGCLRPNPVSLGSSGRASRKLTPIALSPVQTVSATRLMPVKASSSSNVLGSQPFQPGRSLAPLSDTSKMRHGIASPPGTRICAGRSTRILVDLLLSIAHRMRQRFKET
jgi:hypothetical protein